MNLRVTPSRIEAGDLADCAFRNTGPTLAPFLPVGCTVLCSATRPLSDGALPRNHAPFRRSARRCCSLQAAGKTESSFVSGPEI